MKTRFYIIFSLISLSGVCQANTDTVFIKHRNYGWHSDTAHSYKTDTLVFKSISPGEHVLCGTMILPNVDQEALTGYGLWWYNVSSTDCKGHEPFSSGNEIEVINKTDTTLSIETKIISNCCYSFLCDIQVEKDSIVNLIYIGYGAYCDCDCCFGLTYKFKIDTRFQGELQKLKFVMINDDKKTLKPFK